MDFEYHGALRDIAIEHTLVPSGRRHETNQWDTLTQDLVLDYTTHDAMTIDPKALIMSDDEQMGVSRNPTSLFPASSGSTVLTTNAFASDRFSFEGHISQPEGSEKVTASTDVLQAQINQLRETVAHLANSNQSPPSLRQTHHIRKQSLDSLRADSVLSQGSLSTKSDPFTDFNKILGPQEGSYYFGVDTQPEDLLIYSRRGSASTVSSAPSKRGQRVPGGYPCAQCDLAFDIPSQLKHHERKHLAKDERPYPCSQCSEKILFPKDLGRHKERIHGIPITLSSRCSSSFTAKLIDGSCGYSSSAEEHYYSKQNWQSRVSTVRRHEDLWQQRDSRRASIKRKHQASAMLANNHNLPNDVRNATIPETEALNTTTSSHVNAIRGLQIQIDLQQETIDKLEIKLARAEEQAEAWLEERNTFAKVLQRTGGSVIGRPGVFFEQKNKRLPSLAERAKGWLGAIDKLLSTGKGISTDAQTGKALEHISTALDHLDL